MYVIPRLCMKVLRTGKTYTNFNFHYLLQSIVRVVSNSGFFTSLFGDSSFITTYMRYVGWNLNTVYQTGSNMGTEQGHDNPLLCNISKRHDDSGRTEDDQYANVRHVIPACRVEDRRQQLSGKRISYPPNGRTGTNVLLGTKTIVPIDGPVHENVGLLGSPAFEIPRKVDRDRDFNASFDEQTRLAPLRQKNSHNFFTALIFLASQGCNVCHVGAMAGRILNHRSSPYSRSSQPPWRSSPSTWPSSSCSSVRAWVSSHSSRSLLRSTIRISGHTKGTGSYCASPILAMFAGTPFRYMLLRALGMKVGAKLFDGGAGIPERSLVEVG